MDDSYEVRDSTPADTAMTPSATSSANNTLFWKYYNMY